MNRKVIVTGSPSAVAQASQLVHHVMEHGPTLPMLGGATPYAPKGSFQTPYGAPYGAPMQNYASPYGPVAPRGMPQAQYGNLSMLLM